MNKIKYVNTAQYRNAKHHKHTKTSVYICIRYVSTSNLSGKTQSLVKDGYVWNKNKNLTSTNFEALSHELGSWSIPQKETNTNDLRITQKTRNLIWNGRKTQINKKVALLNMLMGNHSRIIFEGYHRISPLRFKIVKFNV